MKDSLYGFITVSLSPTSDYLKALQSLGHLQNSPRVFWFFFPKAPSGIASKTFSLFFFFWRWGRTDICACDIKPELNSLRIETVSSCLKHPWYLASRKGFHRSFPGSSVGKESTCNAGDPSSVPGSGRSTEEGIGYPLQYSWASLVAQLVKNQPAMQET